MTVNQAIDKLCNWAEQQVGYRASKGKRNKYAEYIDKYPEFYNYSKNGFDWCDIFYDVGMCQCFGVETGRKMLYQPKKSTGAGCGFSAGFYRANGAWSKTPQRGSQIFYGYQGNEQHTGIVVGVEDSFIWTIEGNTGGGDGMVQKKKVSRNANIAGYGIPNWKLVADVKEESKPAFNKEYKAIDVSEFQSWIDWNKVKSDGVYAVIIRVGGRFGASGNLYTDKMAEENILGAKKVGLQIGLYYFTQAISEKEAIEEADFAIKMAKAYSLDKKTPIFIDTEHLSGGGRHNNISRQARTDVCKAFCDRVLSSGYNAGIYTGYYWLRDNMIPEKLTKYDIWLAQWASSHASVNNLVIWQYSETGSIKGINGNVDLNKGYKNYWTGATPTPSPTPTPQPTPSMKKLVEDGIFGPLSVKAAQTWLKCKYVDGIVSGQVRSMQRYVPSVTSIEWGTGGSPFVRKLQAKVGSDQDGYFGPNTSKAVQRYLNKQGYNLVVDGIWGPATSKAFQNYLNKVLNLK